MQDARLDESQAGIKTAERNINNLRYADDTTLMTESKEELKSLLMKLERCPWKRTVRKLKTQHWKNEEHGILSHHFKANRRGKNANSDRFFTLFFHLFTRLFSSSSPSALRVVSPAYLMLLILLLAILIPACDSSSLAFYMIYSAYKLNKQGDNIQPWHTPSPVLNQFIVPRPVLNVPSWLAYRFLRRQVRWSDIPISFKNFPQFVVIYTNAFV